MKQLRPYQLLRAGQPREASNISAPKQNIHTSRSSRHRLKGWTCLWLQMKSIVGRLIFIHLQCWEVLPFLANQRQWCIRILCPKDPEFYTPLALNCQKGQHLLAPEVYKISVPIVSGPSRLQRRRRCKPKLEPSTGLTAVKVLICIRTTSWLTRQDDSIYCQTSAVIEIVSERPNSICAPQP